MKRVAFTFICFVLVVSLAGVTQARSPSPIGFSVFKPIQYPSPTQSVRGIRFNLIYGLNRNLTGLDVGLLLPINVVSNRLNGIQLGLYNRAGRGQGIQWGILNSVQDDFEGLQMGLYNRSRYMTGVQFGLVNISHHLSGLQVGLANIKGQPGSGWPREVPHRFFPIVNWTF